jgi:hypothetical protein
MKTNCKIEGENPNEKYIFPYLFQVIVNFMFLLCLSPIYISLPSDGKSVEFKEFKAQKVNVPSVQISCKVQN